MKRRFSGIWRSTDSSTFFWLANFSTSPSESLGASSTASATTFVPSRMRSERSSLLPFKRQLDAALHVEAVDFLQRILAHGRGRGFLGWRRVLAAAAVAGTAGAGASATSSTTGNNPLPTTRDSANGLKRLVALGGNVVGVFFEVGGEGFVVSPIRRQSREPPISGAAAAASRVRGFRIRMPTRAARGARVATGLTAAGQLLQFFGFFLLQEWI